jgi:hypothetical protein
MGELWTAPRWRLPRMVMEIWLTNLKKLFRYYLRHFLLVVGCLLNVLKEVPEDIFCVLFVPQSCLYVLTKEEVQPTMEKDEIRVELDNTILRFIDLARQMEAFFLQKRFLLSALKPELIVKEVNVFQAL